MNIDNPFRCFINLPLLDFYENNLVFAGKPFHSKLFVGDNKG